MKVGTERSAEDQQGSHLGLVTSGTSKSVVRESLRILDYDDVTNGPEPRGARYDCSE